MSIRTKTVLSLICNAAVFLATLGVMISYFIVPGELIRNGWESFMFFTTDSNVLAALACGLTIICDVKILRAERTTVARPFMLLKYAGVVSLLLTFFTVMCLLVPLYGAALELGGTGAHMHVIAPVLCLVSFLFFDPHTKLGKRDALFGILPVVLYGTFYFLQVVVFKNWWDFYAFNSGGRWYLIMPAIFGISYLMSLLVRLLHNRINKRNF